MKTTKLSLLILVLVACSMTATAAFHPITKCTSLTFTKGNVSITVSAPVGNAAWVIPGTVNNGNWTVKDCNQVTLGTYNANNGTFTP